MAKLKASFIKMKKKGLLRYEKKRDDFSIIPFSGTDGITIEHLIPILVFIDKLVKKP